MTATTPEVKTKNITNNVMRSCFDAVQKHPGKTKQELINLMTSQGFKESSTVSVFSQLIRTGQAIKGDDGLIHPNPAIKEYRPISLPTTRNTLKHARAIVKAQTKKQPKGTQSAGIAALKADTTPTPEAAPQEPTNTVTVAPQRGVTTLLIKRDWTPQQVIDTLTLPQAKALYAELQQYFK